MNILITGAKGFVGRNLVENLKTLADGRNKTRPDLHITKIYEYDIDNTEAELDKFCSDCDFVFNLAGVNRPKDNSEFQAGNFGFASKLLTLLKKHGNTCPVMLSSSIQASLVGRFADSEYGRSKLAGEELFFNYSKETGSKVYVYRFPNLAGKWCKPNYNSAVATFCYNIAHDLPITVNDPAVELELLFIDDLLEELYDCLEGKPHHCDYPHASTIHASTIIEGTEYDGLTPRWIGAGRYCGCPITHKVTLGQIVGLLKKFKNEGTHVPDLTECSFEKKLYSMYISYLPPKQTIMDLRMNVDERGSFTELIHTKSAGQVSVNITKPGVTKGLHWHNHKLERFIVVSGQGLIQERRLGSDEVEEYNVCGEHIQSVIQKPGFVHSIKNIGNTDLVTIMWTNENFNPEKPDTFFENVDISQFGQNWVVS